MIFFDPSIFPDLRATLLSINFNPSRLSGNFGIPFDRGGQTSIVVSLPKHARPFDHLFLRGELLIF
jgi:hypothetical protein